MTELTQVGYRAQQLLDRAATLISDVDAGNDTDQATSREWLKDYHQEKARFGQPEGSPAYDEVAPDTKGRTKATSAPEAQAGTKAKGTQS